MQRLPPCEALRVNTVEPTKPTVHFSQRKGVLSSSPIAITRIHGTILVYLPTNFP